MTMGTRHCWEEISFGRVVAHSAFGPRFSGDKYADDGGVATLRTTDLDSQGRISYETMPLARLNEDRFPNHLLQPGDLVISRSGTCGIAAVFEGFTRSSYVGSHKKTARARAVF
jgi:type I restriction enzyme S subunit